MADALFACPFCGGKPEFRRSGRQGHYIACTSCDASANMFTALKEDVRDLLVETWNRRSPAPSPHLVPDAKCVCGRAVCSYDPDFGCGIDRSGEGRDA